MGRGDERGDGLCVFEYIICLTIEKRSHTYNYSGTHSDLDQ